MKFAKILSKQYSYIVIDVSCPIFVSTLFWRMLNVITFKAFLQGDIHRKTLKNSSESSGRRIPQMVGGFAFDMLQQHTVSTMISSEYLLQVQTANIFRTG